jgi:putative transposase
MTHADIGAAKTIRDRAFSIVRGDSSELKRPKQRKEKSVRPCGKRIEPGNLNNQDIKAVMS